MIQNTENNLHTVFLSDSQLHDIFVMSNLTAKRSSIINAFHTISVLQSIGLNIQSNNNIYHIVDVEKFIFAKLKYGL